MCHGPALRSTWLLAALLPWLSWLDCYASDAALGEVCVQADALLLPLAGNTAVGEAEAMWGWPQLRILLQRLYSKAQRTRRSAAAQLLALVGGHGILDDQQVEGKHLQHCTQLIMQFLGCIKCEN